MNDEVIIHDECPEGCYAVKISETEIRCKDCCFYHSPHDKDFSIKCCGSERKDNNDVIFKIIEND